MNAFSTFYELMVRDDHESEPRWPALVALLVVAGLNLALSDHISFGPRWLLPLVIALLSIPTVLTHRARLNRINQILGYTTLAIETIAIIGSVGLMVVVLTQGGEKPIPLLRSAGLLWISNILVFALWYWRLDAGGPHARNAFDGHTRGAILFPQMTIPNDSPNKDKSWEPHFVDYLFLAFNNSTAFSPTDAPVLSRWAKVLTMLQASISLVIVALLAARAVNILS